MQITEIITDETLREIREHGTPEFPFEYYLDDIDEIGQGYVEWHWHNAGLEMKRLSLKRGRGFL